MAGCLGAATKTERPLALATYKLGARGIERRDCQCHLRGQHFTETTDSRGSAAGICRCALADRFQSDAAFHAGKPNDRRWRELSMTIGSADTIQDLPIPQGRRGVSTPDSPDVRRRRKNT